MNVTVKIGGLKELQDPEDGEAIVQPGGIISARAMCLLSGARLLPREEWPDGEVGITNAKEERDGRTQMSRS